MPIGAIVGGVSSLIGDVVGGSAASKAAAAQASAAQQAQNLEQQNANQALNSQKTASNQAQSNLNPYVQAGQSSLAKLGATQPFQAPTAAQAAATPGYQFQLQQGLKALQNSAAAGGSLLTGGTAKAINNYAQGQAASNYGNTYNQALQSYQTNFGNQMGIAQLGANAGTNLSGLEQQNANASGNILQTSAQQQAQQLNNQGAATASGYAAQGNAIGQGISSIGNLAGSLIPKNINVGNLFGNGGNQTTPTGYTPVVASNANPVYDEGS